MLRRAHTPCTREQDDSVPQEKKRSRNRSEKGGAKSLDNFLTQCRVKERNEKHQKRKKESKNRFSLLDYGNYILLVYTIY